MKHKILICIALFGLFSTSIYAQERAVAKGDKQYDRYAYIDAIKTYERIAEKGYKSVEMFQKLGNSYYFNSQLEQAAKWYGELFAMGQEVEPEYYYRYSQSLKATGNYAKANEMMATFNSKVRSDSRGKLATENKNYLEVIKSNSGRYEMADAGVNTEYSDYGSAIIGNKLVFASARDTGNFSKRIHKWTNAYFTNLYAAELSGDTLGSVEKFAKKANSKFNEASAAFSKDGKTMYFTRNNYTNGKKGKDDNKNTLVKIYQSKLEKKGDKEDWAEATEVSFNSNSYSTAHPAISPDGKTMYFASDMPGTLGQSDIFKVAINEDGSFGTPVNLGPTINTPGKETFPAMTDENELYFATDGHPGLGGLDIFMARLKEDGTFRAPVNIGKPANSPKDDFAYIIDTKTRKGFLTSNREGGKGFDDIYKFLETRKLICEQFLSGLVTDLETGAILPGAKVTLSDAKLVKIAEFIADEKGYYEFEVECDTEYYVKGEKETYETKEQKIKISKENGKTELAIQLEKTLPVDGGGDGTNIKVGDNLADAFGIKEILFDLDKSNIRPDAALELEKILDVLKQYPAMTLDVRAHTDSRASHAYNQKLSERRTKSTVAWLVKNGVAKKRLTGKGYGETQLVNKCADGVECSEAEHQLNRRSQFIITKL